MNSALKPIALAILVATTQLASVAYAGAAKIPATAAATEASVSIKSPEEWVNETGNTYPAIAEPQRHFTDAISAYARKDFKTAAADILDASAYLRVEAGRATGDAQRELDRSVAQLDRLATSVEKGAVKDRQTMTNDFAEANHALALEHRSKAAESWAREKYHKAGYEFKAAAGVLESGAAWAGAQAKSGASATVAETRALGNKLASDANWTRDEVAKGFESLSQGINALGEKIGGNKRAPSFSAGA